jgi:hypothetical protein
MFLISFLREFIPIHVRDPAWSLMLEITSKHISQRFLSDKVSALFCCVTTVMSNFPSCKLAAYTLGLLALETLWKFGYI